MLAIATTHQLTLVDPQGLRRPPPSLPPCLSLLVPCTSSAWSPDNLSLFLSSARTIHQYNPALNTLTDVYSSPDIITHLVCKTKSCLAFATADKIHVLDSTRIIQTFNSHKSLITSLSLSGDLLASTSAGAAHVHNLSLGSHVILRGLNMSGQRITTSVFHPHNPSRLLLGVGARLILCDTTRPSAPLKTIHLNDTSTGEIVSVACSPFSKTLVAVASADGNVGLVDLDKEKGLFRTLSLKVPVTSVAFSPEGASMYLGTETGKLFIVDLRALDKPPKSVAVSESGCRVETMTVQKKMRGMDASAKPTPAVKGEANNPTRLNSAVTVPTNAASKTALKGVSSPSKGRSGPPVSAVTPHRKPSTSSVLSPKTASNTNSKVSSPVGGVGTISIRSKERKGIVTTMTETNKTAKLGAAHTLSKAPDGVSAGLAPSRASTASKARKPSIESVSPRSDARVRISSATHTISESAHLRLLSSACRPNLVASTTSSIPPVPASSVSVGAGPVLPQSRTPTPELPSINEPTTPLTAERKSTVLESPEAPDNRSRGKGKGKTVNFEDIDRNVSSDNEKENDRERNLSMQISPRRPSSMGLGNSASWSPSPLRNAIPTSPLSGGSSAHDLLRTVVRDVMFDWKKEGGVIRTVDIEDEKNYLSCGEPSYVCNRIRLHHA
ncbi:WD40-repeat-containing domain protein [Mycena pura]|uniref:WD40-repeat-containing domain protein n=1 Tax=Mycena pura TaxID=153505 RepID=A0AAD6VQK0_9AGAR|nr:WD40-repeat-containing domain protein [Mycena pura]